jgi:hypothetical protein
MARMEHHSPEYLKINPLGVIPTLIHDGKPLHEVIERNTHASRRGGLDCRRGQPAPRRISAPLLIPEMDWTLRC